jgi:hypothetical protein
LSHAFVEAPLCGRCAAEPPGIDRARSALRYDGQSSRVVLGFKRGGRLDGVGLFARWMVQAGDELLADADLIRPVPLHRWRLLARGFNQSAVLAQRIARSSGRPWAPSLLERHRATASQQGLGAAARQENVTAAYFRVRRPERVAGGQGAAGGRRADDRRHARRLRRRAAARGRRAGGRPDPRAGGKGRGFAHMMPVLHLRDAAGPFFSSVT